MRTSIRPIFLASLIIGCLVSIAKAQDFEFGKVRSAELEMKSYPADTTAGAVVLSEFGEAHIETSDRVTLTFLYHSKIKILKRSGFEKANFAIVLQKSNGSQEHWLSLEAVTHNLDGTSIKTSSMDSKAFFVDKASKYYDIIKFTLPDIRIGSVIEVRYTLSSPFFFNFRSWEFQDDIPKIRSEYWANIPANYDFNIALKGYLQLSKTENKIIKDCFVAGGITADCTLIKYIMENIPAFPEEEFMTAKSNYLSAINFELSQIRTFDGRVDRISRDWKDVDDELRQHENFGKQIRKARGLDDPKLKSLVGNETNPLQKATIIYEYIKGWFAWDGTYSKYSVNDTKKAYESQKGNVGDINLTLIGVLQSYDVDADPVMLSTRSNGEATKLYPVLSEFNYVIARVKIGEKTYLLDATDDFLPFGMLPIRCLNGSGRLISKTESSWVELNPREKKKTFTMVEMKLMDDGKFDGKILIQSHGYAAMMTRREIASSKDHASYGASVEKKMLNAEIQDYKIENFEDLSKALVESMKIKMDGFSSPESSTLYFNPFFINPQTNNPFKSNERFFPVDLGMAEESTFVLVIELPPSIKVEESPAPVAIALPLNGGKFILGTTIVGNTIQMSNTLSFNKSIYSPQEYHFLKEFYARVIQAHESQFVFKRR